MISVIYAILATMLILALSYHVIRLRWHYHVSLGDGNNKELRTAMGAQSNAVEYLPISLLLLFAMELNGMNLWVVHAFGMALLGSRLLHAFAMLQKKMPLRVLAMRLTFFIMTGLILANLVVIPYGQLFRA
jgi:uncharacterized membrane protein YecN with MAPEG domain